MIEPDTETIDPRELEEAAEFARLLEGHDGSGTPQDLVETAALLRAAQATRTADPSIEQRLPAIEEQLFGRRRSKRLRVASVAAIVAAAAAVFFFVREPESGRYDAASRGREALVAYGPQAEAPQAEARDPLAGLRMRGSSASSGMRDQVATGPAAADPLVVEQASLLADPRRSLQNLESIARSERVTHLLAGPREVGQGPVEPVIEAYRRSERQGYDDAIVTLREAARIANVTFFDRSLIGVVESDVALARALRALRADEPRDAIRNARAGLRTSRGAQTTSLWIVLARAHDELGDRAEAEAAHQRALVSFAGPPHPGSPNGLRR